MKATEQYVPVVLFIMLYKAVLTSEFLDEILKWVHSIQMKAIEQYCPVVLFITPYKESAEESLRCDKIPSPST